MENRIVGICIFGCGLIMLSCLATCHLNEETFVDQDTYFEGDRFWSLPVRNLGTCAVLCMRMTNCVSFNFDTSNRKCEMNSDILEDNKHLGKSKRGSLYSRIKRWPQELDPDCFPRPCKIDEVCIPQQLSKHLNNQPRCLNARRKQGECGPLANPINGVVKVSGIQTGDTANYTCNTPYALTGDRTRICQADGFWNGTDPTCTGTCSSLPVLVNGSVSVTGTQTGDAAIYACSHCYALNGDRTRICQADGSWNGTEPTCTAMPSHGDHCYYFVTEKKRWSEASHHCNNTGSYLVDIQSEGENNFLLSQLQDLNVQAQDWWIGLHRQRANNRYVWANSGALEDTNYKNWAPGEPNHSDDCIRLKDRANYKWADMNCTNKYFFICEKA